MNFLRLALRRASKHRLLSAVIVGLLAIGIGVNVIVFALLNSVAFGRLPYPQAERLVVVNLAPRNFVYGMRQSIPYALYDQWTRSVRSVEQWGAVSWIASGMTLSDQKRELIAVTITPSTLKLLGVRTHLGRPFEPADDRVGALKKVMFSYAFWRSAFQGDSGVIGRYVRLNGANFEVSGVVDRGFVWPGDSPPNVWVPPSSVDRGEHTRVFVYAKLRANASLERMRAELSRVDLNSFVQPDRDGSPLVVSAIPMRTELVIGHAAELTIIQLLAIVVLVIACGNAAGLLLARMQADAQNVGTRVILGARSQDLLMVSLADVVPPVIAGTAIGLALAHRVIPALGSYLGTAVPAWADVRINTTVMLGSLLVSGFAAIVTASIPAREFFRLDLRSWLQEGARGIAGGRRAKRKQRRLVSLQIGVSTTLLLMAALLVMNYFRLSTADEPLLRGEGSMQGDFTIPANASASLTMSAVLQRLSMVDGVAGGAFTQRLQLDLRNQAQAGVYTDRSSEPVLGLGSAVLMFGVGPQSRQRTPVRVSQGRDFTDAEIAASIPDVVILNEDMASRLWPRQSPLGRRVRIRAPLGDEQSRTVVGVVRNSNPFVQSFAGMGMAARVFPTFYVPGVAGDRGHITLTVYTRQSAAGLMDKVATAIDEVALASVSLLLSSDEARRATHIQARVRTFLLVGLACIAILLSTVGVASLIAYSTGLRRHEFGIRTALGATSAAVALEVVRDALRSTAGGIGLGIAGSAVAVLAFIPMLYFGARIFDWRVFLGVIVAMNVLTIAASLAPAWRAARLHPAEVLRAE